MNKVAYTVLSQNEGLYAYDNTILFLQVKLLWNTKQWYVITANGYRWIKSGLDYIISTVLKIS